MKIGRNNLRIFVILQGMGRRTPMSNIYDTANAIERDLRKAEQYTDLKEAYKTIQEDEEANAILTEFQTLQQTLFQKQQTGQEISEEEATNAQAVSAKMSENELTMDLMEKERTLNQLLQDINEIIMKPVQEIYMPE